MSQVKYKELKEVIEGLGLSLFGVSSIGPLLEHRQRLIRWQENGYAADLGYMQRSAELLTSPQMLLSEAKSVVSIIAPYSHRPNIRIPPGYGRIARYAWGADYHRVIKKLLLSLVEQLSASIGPIVSRSFTDAVPLLERALAAQAGLGFFGRNSMLITPKLGSFYLIGEILWDVEVVELPPIVINCNSCGTCVRCIKQCPTNAIVADGVVNSARCISYLTIEKSGVFSEWESQAIGSWLHGCDICQDVCPFNHSPIKIGMRSPLEKLNEENGAGQILKLSELLDIESDSEFLERFKGTPLMRPGREGILRNALSVAANTSEIGLIPRAKKLLDSDSSAVIRAQAGLALARLQAIASN